MLSHVARQHVQSKTIVDFEKELLLFISLLDVSKRLKTLPQGLEALSRWISDSGHSFKFDFVLFFEALMDHYSMLSSLENFNSLYHSGRAEGPFDASSFQTVFSESMKDSMSVMRPQKKGKALPFPFTSFTELTSFRL
jgi:hypothetical protein